MASMTLYGVTPYVDQVPRRLVFELKHPEIKIRPPGHGYLVWSALIPGIGELHAIDLRRLLDKLELGFPAESGDYLPDDTGNLFDLQNRRK